jgi:hypothetical protein
MVERQAEPYFVHHGQASGVKTSLEKRGNKSKEELKRKEYLSEG